MFKEFHLVRTDCKSNQSTKVTAEQVKNTKEWKGLCPYHSDQNPSLFINAEKRIFFCQACNAKGKLKNEEIVNWEKPISEWVYRDENGKNVSKKVKYSKSINGGITYDKKTYVQYKWTGEEWKTGLTLKNSVLYNLPTLVTAKKGSSIFIVEGEKDADNLSKHYIATTTTFGAGKWSCHYNKYFQDMNVYIVPDEDEQGYNHAIRIGNELKGIASTVNVIFMGDDNSPKGYDFSDWIGDGHTKEEFVELMNNAPCFDISLFSKYDTINTDTAIDFHTKIDAKRFNLTEAGNAERFASQHGGKIRFNWTSNTWLYFDGKRWNPSTGKAMAQRMALQTARSILDEVKDMTDTDKRSKYIKWSMYSEKANALTNMLSIAKSMEPIEAYNTMFDTNQYLLNIENGTIDLKTGELRKHNPNDMITKLAPVVYDKDADCPLWKSCLSTWMEGDTDAIDYLQRLAGMCLTGDITSRTFPIFYGSGKNGKSVFLDTIRELMGDYATVAPKDFLALQKNTSHPTEIAGLINMRLVVVSETPKNMKLRVDLVKSMTGDAILKGRFMRQDFFEFKITHKVILMTQNLPIIDETTDAIWDRVHRVGWRVRIPVEKQNNHLLSDLTKEKSGILNWLIEGCLKWQKDGYLKPTASIIHETVEYRRNSEPLREFIDEKCSVGNDLKIKKTILYNVYKDWTDDKYPMKIRSFNREMEDMKFKWKDVKIEGKTAKYWLGLGLKTDDCLESEDIETEE